MKICFICNEYPPAPHGGVGIYVKTLSERLAKKGYKPIVIGMYPKTWHPLISEENGVRIFRLPMTEAGGHRAGFFVNRLKLAQRVYHLSKKEKLEIVEAPEGGGWSMFFKHTCPNIIRLHNLAPYFSWQEGRSRGRLTVLAETIAFRKATKISAVSKFIAKETLKLYPYARLKTKGIKVIYNGIDTDLFVKAPYQERDMGRIMFAGTIKAVKGIKTLFKAFDIVGRESPDYLLYLYGKDTYIAGGSYLMKTLDSTLQDGNVKERIRYVGPVPGNELPSAYAKASVCVFPSFAESFGLVAAEAMSCARPVIYSNATAGPELIEDKKTGHLCNPADYRQLADIILHTLRNPSDAEAIGLAAAERIRNFFSLERCIEENLKYYEEAHSVG
ncbi:MAG: glycosyltransferase family 4 protein [Desulfobacca sp.]|nr:glycosyltransferase family 4 protein [Desulfobacca sp.]